MLADAPFGHPDHYLALVDLADVLHQRSMREEGAPDLDEIITLRRAALEHTPPGHPDRLETHTRLADCLGERFWEKVNMDDLMEAISSGVLRCNSLLRGTKSMSSLLSASRLAWNSGLAMKEPWRT